MHRLANWQVIEGTRKTLEKTQRDLELTQKILKEVQDRKDFPSAQWVFHSKSEGIWKNVEAIHSNKLETLYESRVSKAQYRLDNEGATYEVDFVAMTLYNTVTKELVHLNRQTLNSAS
jgi:hypothetical protein